MIINLQIVIILSMPLLFLAVAGVLFCCLKNCYKGMMAYSLLTFIWGLLLLFVGILAYLEEGFSLEEGESLKTPILAISLGVFSLLPFSLNVIFFSQVVTKMAVLACLFNVYVIN